MSTGSAPAFSELSASLQRVRALLAALVRQCSQKGVALPPTDPTAATLTDVATVLAAAQSAAPNGLPGSQPLAEASAALAASEAGLANTVSGASSMLDIPRAWKTLFAAPMILSYTVSRVIVLKVPALGGNGGINLQSDTMAPPLLTH